MKFFHAHILLESTPFEWVASDSTAIFFQGILSRTSSGWVYNEIIMAWHWDVSGVILLYVIMLTSWYLSKSETWEFFLLLMKMSSFGMGCLVKYFRPQLIVDGIHLYGILVELSAVHLPPVCLQTSHSSTLYVGF